jgi:hypothetical protein
MSRELYNHRVNPAINPGIKITVDDEAGQGGACHEYWIGTNNYGVSYSLKFQNGPIKEVGINGITHEALLAILIDRLRCFQAGEYANDYNENAMYHCMGALKSLHDRTIERQKRNVEGTHEK